MNRLDLLDRSIKGVARAFHHGPAPSASTASTLSSTMTATSTAIATAASATVGSTATCTAINITPSPESIVGSINFQHLAVYIAGGSAIVAIIICIWMILDHALHCYRVAEQKLLMRVIVIIPVYSVFYFVCTIDYNAYPYLENVPKIVEAISFCSLYQLCVEYVAGGDKDQQDLYFMNLERHAKRGIFSRIAHPHAAPVAKHRHGSLRWFRGITTAIVQFPVVCLIWTSLYIIVTATICQSGKHGKFLKIIDSVVNSSTTIVAIVAMYHFYTRLRSDLKPHHAVRKVFILKKVIGISVTQAFIIGIVSGAGAIQPTATMSYGDFTIGVPCLMVCCEMMLFCTTFLWAYSAKEYKDLARFADREGLLHNKSLPDSAPMHKTSPVKALLAALNIWDLLQLCGRSFLFLVKGRSGPSSYVAVGVELKHKEQNAGDYHAPPSNYGGMGPVPQQPKPYHPTTPIAGGLDPYAHAYGSGGHAYETYGPAEGGEGPAYTGRDVRPAPGPREGYEGA